MITTSEKSTTLPTLSVHHTIFLWASFACHELVLCTTHRIFAQ